MTPELARGPSMCSSLLMLLLLLLVVSSEHQNLVAHARRLHADAAPLDARPLASLANDLNRTTAHVQPTAGAGSPGGRPRAPAGLGELRAHDAPGGGGNSSARRAAGALPASGQRAPLVAAGPAAVVRAKWRQIEESLADAHTQASAELKRTLEQLWPVLDDQGRQVTGACRRALDELVAGLAGQELWASRMMDASAGFKRLPSGLLEGTLTELGNFDECLAPVGPAQGKPPTAGHYCTVLVTPPLTSRPRLHTICRRLPGLAAAVQGAPATGAAAGTPLRLLAQHSHEFHYAGLRLGLCVPSRCGQTDVQRLLQAYLLKHELSGQVKHCQRAPAAAAHRAPGNSSHLAPPWVWLGSLALGPSISQTFDLTQQCILFTFLCLALVCALGTWLDNNDNNNSSSNSNSNNHDAGDADDDAERTTPRPASGAPLGACSACGGGGDGCGVSQALAAGKRAQRYRVCRSDSASAGSSDADDLDAANFGSGAQHWRRPSSPPSHELKLQRNPLAGLGCAVVSAAGPLDLSQPPQRPPPPPLPPAPKPPRRAASGGGGGGNGQQMAAVRLNSLPMFMRRELEREQLLASATCPRPGPAWRELLCCFSLKRNLRSIGKLTAQPAALAGGGRVAAADSMRDLKVVHGLRTLAMVWIIFGHTIGLVSPEMMNNLFPLASLSCSSRLLQAMLNTTLAVDTFFMISGLVTVISFARRCKSAHALVEPAPAPGPHSQTPQGGKLLAGDEMHPAHLAGRLASDIEVSSVDSSSSPVTSLSSCVSSSGRAGLSSKSSSQRNFILNKTLGSGGVAHQQRPAPHGADAHRGAAAAAAGSGWPADFRPLVWLLMRYLRLTPAYASVIGLSVVLPALGSGPFWPETAGQLGQACRANWWANLLYANNFIETDKLCLIHSWYLSNDFQFFALALTLIGVHYKSRKLAVILFAGAFVASSAATFIVTLEHNYPPTIVTTSPALDERWQFIHSLYYKPWPHMPAYLIGLLAGYLIVKFQLASSGCARPASQWAKVVALRIEQQVVGAQSPARALGGPRARLLCWLLCGVTAFAVLNSVYPWNMGLQVDPMLAGLHSATFRTLWAACCAWLVFALASRPRNPLALLLSWHGFQLTSRLTYCAYLVHPLLIYYHFGTLRERIDSSPYGQAHRFLGTLAASYLVAFGVSLVAESPAIQLQRLLASGRLRSSRPKHDQPPQEEEEVVDFFGKTRAHRSQAPRRAKSRASSGAPACGRTFVCPAGHVCGHAPAAHGLGPAGNAGRERARAPPYEPAADGRCSSHGSSHSAIDEEFQRKLAHAIGRGFKIRSKIVDGKPRQPPRAPDAGARAAPAQYALFGPPGTPAGSGGARNASQSSGEPAGPRSLEATTREQAAAGGARGSSSTTFVRPNKTHT